MNKKNNYFYFKLYLKGIFMGIADLVPGISGGTIAFILGIYERLIHSIKKINFNNYSTLLLSIRNKKEFTKKLKELDILFLLILFLGIISSIISLSHLISFLLEKFEVFLLSFFVGLILMSSVIIFKHIEKKTIHEKSFFLYGFLFGFSLLFLDFNLINDPTFFYVFLGGFLAVFALFLPGISGSFILLILGLYEYIINIVKNIYFEFVNLLPFLLGAFFGVFLVSRFVDFLFKINKSKTLFFLLGLVIGSLFIPLELIFSLINTYDGLGLFICFLLFLFGILCVYLLEKYN